ncbi:MAG: hypothetical protein ACOCZ8_00495 [Bacteroidota bacterium]
MTSFDEGLAAYNARKFESAIRKFSVSLTVDPANAAAYYYRGLCWQHLDAPVSAEEDFSKAESLNPSFEDKVAQALRNQRHSKDSDSARPKGARGLLSRLRHAMAA